MIHRDCDCRQQIYFLKLQFENLMQLLDAIMEKFAYEQARKFALMYFVLNMLSKCSVAMVKCTTLSDGKQGFIVESIRESFPCTKTSCHETGGIFGCMKCCRAKRKGSRKSTKKPTVFGALRSQAVTGRIFVLF